MQRKSVGIQSFAMQRRMRTRVTLFDGLLVVLCALLALSLLFLPRLAVPRGSEVIISYLDEEKTEVYSLFEQRTLLLEHGGHQLIVRIENGQVWVEESSCPDGVCVHGGKISRVGQILVCAPAGVSISIRGVREEGDADAVAG